jgi:hypothetical protein
VRAGVKPASRPRNRCLPGLVGPGAEYRHDPVVQGRNAETLLPIVHVLFSNLKTWPDGTYHGLSAKHPPR